MDKLKRIAWKCRRGMLELDLILLQFYQQKFSELDENEKQVFDQILDEQDPILASWLFGSSQPDNLNFIDLITQIKSFRFNHYK